MKTDLYTKAVLTVIAGCLLVIASERFVSPPAAQAQGPTHVVVDAVKVTRNGQSAVEVTPFALSDLGNAGMPVFVTP